MTETPQTPPPSNRIVYAVVGVALAALLFGAGAFVWMGGGAGQAGVGGPFQLVDGDGRAVSDRDFRGKYLLIYFGYTFCPDVCPTSLNTVSDALDRLGAKADRVQPLFVTVDPKRDTPAVVKQYATAFGPRFVGLTGTQAQTDAAARAYRVYFREHRTGPGPDDYSMDHSSMLYLVGPDGAFLAPVRAEQPPQEMAAALARWVK
jgi:protein SCO1/2